MRNDFALELYEGVKTTVPLVGSEGRTIPAGSVGVIVDVSAAAYLVEITAGPEMDFSFCDALVWARRDELVLC